MHMIIRAIVYAKDEVGALEQAVRVFEQLTDKGDTFDYYRMFRKEDAGTGVSGSDRWGDMNAVSEVTSEEGKKLIEEGMKYQKQDFIEAMEAIREGVNKYTDDELFEDNVKIRNMTRMFRYFCRKVSEYEGSNIYLYDNYGEGIISEKRLKEVLAQENEQGEKLKVYIIPADVHY